MKVRYCILLIVALILSSCKSEDNENNIVDFTQENYREYNDEDLVTANVISARVDEIFYDLDEEKLESQNISSLKGFDFNNCEGCPESLIVNQFFDCNCVSIVAFIDGLADPISCYRYKWDFGPFELSSVGANTLTPTVCFDVTAIHEATGQSGYMMVTIFLDVWKDGCLKTFPIKINLLAC